MLTWSPIAKDVLATRYLLRNKAGQIIETEDQMLERVANHVAQAEQDKEHWAKQFLSIMSTLEFLPNSPCLINAGRKDGQLAACFVLPIEDNMQSIFNTLKQMAMVHKTGGGTGFSFSNLRPAGSIVGTTRGVASGPLSFLSIYSAATDVVKQGGVRRGANLGVLDITHPDIMEWIRCKRDGNRWDFSNFNLSVAIPDSFMENLGSNKQFRLYHKKFHEERHVSTDEMFHEICYGMWLCGDPGVLFIDTMNKHNPTPWLGKFQSTNPCSEANLLPHESCNLGSINLAALVRNRKNIDFDRLNEIVGVAIRFLDNIIEVNTFPTKKIKDATLRTRKIGLGVMGWADALMELRIPYDSREALVIAEDVMSKIDSRATDESRKLALERGPYSAYRGKKVRNATRTSIAPTGSISLIANTSSGIEPNFALDYFNHTNLPNGANNDHHVISPYVNERGQPWTKTALEIIPEWHVRIQAAFQRHTDQGVSKTINCPNSATVEDIKKAVILAWELGCKGLTVFRDGSKEGVLRVGEMSECPGDRCLV